MPTDLATDTRYATMTAAEVLATVTELLAQYAAEDAARAARLAALESL